MQIIIDRPRYYYGSKEIEIYLNDGTEIIVNLSVKFKSVYFENAYLDSFTELDTYDYEVLTHVEDFQKKELKLLIDDYAYSVNFNLIEEN